MNFFSKIFLTAWLGVQSFLGINHTEQVEQPATVFGGTFNPTGGQTYRLQSSISSTQTSITLSSFKEPVSNLKYTMSYLNSDIEYGTIDPQNNNSKEYVSFTGITQNADGTATLTGVTRGLGFSYPYTASTTLQQPHSGQSIFILSNPPQLYNKYANKSNDQSILAIWDFSTYLPTTSIAATSSNQFANKAYVDSVAVAGAPVATEAVTGIARLATQLQMASSTFSAGAPTVLYSKYSTSSPYTTGLYIPITRNDGKLSPLFIGTTTSDNYIWGGTSRFNGLSLFTASTTLTATTSISATNVLSNALILNNLAYSFPSVRGASSTVLTENGSGSLVWMPPTGRQYSFIGTTDVSATGGYATSTEVMNIPAGIMTASSTISIIGEGTCNGASGTTNCTVYVRYANGANTKTFISTDFGSVDNGENGGPGIFNITINNNSLTSQNAIATAFCINPSVVPSSDCAGSEATSAIDTSSAFNITLVVRSTSATALLSRFSIIVTP